jgi:hypothetical protein
MAITLSLIPNPTNPNTKLYIGQKLLLTVVATATSGSTVPPNSSAQLGLRTGLQFDTSDPSTDYSGQRPFVLSDNNTIGQATFILDALPGTPGPGAADLEVIVQTFGLGLDTPSTFHYTTLAPRLNPLIAGPSNPYIPVPPNTVSNPLLPIPQNSQYTALYSATLGIPLPYYVIDWHEADTSQSASLFLEQMYTYLHSTDTAPLAYPANKGTVVQGNDGKYFIRTVTDITGVISLYLVANNQNAAGGVAAGAIDVRPWHDDHATTGGLLVSNLIPSDWSIQALLALGPDGKVDYESVSGADIPVNVTVPQAQQGDPVYTFINGSLGDIFLYDPSITPSIPPPFNTKFPKIKCSDDNIMQFASVGRQNGTINVSVGLPFQGEGERSNVPIGGGLSKATLYRGGNIINRYFVQDSMPDVGIRISLSQATPPNPPPYMGQVGDSITVTAYLNGYDGSGAARDPDAFTCTAQPVQVRDVAAGYATVTLNKEKFKNWGPALNGDRTYCYIVYHVYRPSSPTLLSDVFQVIVDTR